MPFLNDFARLAVKPFPQLISPKTHAVLDYVMVGMFLIGASRLWRGNKRAAIAALACGGTELAVSLLTDYPGGVKKVISFRTHRQINFGLGAMTISMPEFLAFDEESDKKFFLTQGTIISAVGELTRLPEHRQRRGKKEKRAA